MMSELLLDTCACIWLSEDSPMSGTATEAIQTSAEDGVPIYLSPITAWERGMLVAKGRLTSPISPKNWFDGFAGRREILLAPLTAEILIDASFLPGDLHGDPADRILIATARALDLTIVTRDRLILDYAAKGHARALAC